MEIKITLPLLPLRDIVVFPSMVIPLFVGRDKSVNALEQVMSSDKKIMLITQKSATTDDPKKDDLFDFGTVANVLQLLKLPDGTVKVMVEGNHTIKITKFNNEKEQIRKLKFCYLKSYNCLLVTCNIIVSKSE